jgi:hypothetical protein
MVHSCKLLLGGTMEFVYRETRRPLPAGTVVAWTSSFWQWLASSFRYPEYAPRVSTTTTKRSTLRQGMPRDQHRPKQSLLIRPPSLVSSPSLLRCSDNLGSMQQGGDAAAPYAFRNPVHPLTTFAAHSPMHPSLHLGSSLRDLERLLPVGSLCFGKDAGLGAADVGCRGPLGTVLVIHFVPHARSKSRGRNGLYSWRDHTGGIGNLAYLQ